MDPSVKHWDGRMRGLLLPVRVLLSANLFLATGFFPVVSRLPSSQSHTPTSAEIDEPSNLLVPEWFFIPTTLWPALQPREHALATRTR
jgi:hypothetical protein